MTGYQPIINFVESIKKMDAQGFSVEAAVFVFIGIDTLCRLSLPLGETKQTRTHFKEWVQKYFKGHSRQPYQYNPEDMYAARCSLLHNYGSEADIHTGTPTLKKFGYHDGGTHFIKPDIDPNFVIIGTKSFVNDFTIAVSDFIVEAKTNPNLKARIDSRIGQVFAHFPIDAQTP